MKSVVTVLLHAGYILSSLVFVSSAVVSLITYLKIARKEKANAVWVSRQWLLVLFLGFGFPCFFLGFWLWRSGEITMVLVTGVMAAALGVVLGIKAEERLRNERFG